MAELLSALQNKSLVRIHDPRSAALIFESTSYYLILDWLNSDGSAALTDFAHALCLYNLQALGINCHENKIQGYIDQVLNELSREKTLKNSGNNGSTPLFAAEERGRG